MSEWSKRVTVRHEKHRNGEAHIILFDGQMVGKVVGKVFSVKKDRRVNFYRNFGGYGINDVVLKAAQHWGGEELYLMEENGPIYTCTIEQYLQGIAFDDPRHGPQHLIRVSKMEKRDPNQMQLL